MSVGRFHAYEISLRIAGDCVRMASNRRLFRRTSFRIDLTCFRFNLAYLRWRSDWLRYQPVGLLMPF
jgi:hypothetical protein